MPAIADKCRTDPAAGCPFATRSRSGSFAVRTRTVRGYSYAPLKGLATGEVARLAGHLTQLRPVLRIAAEASDDAMVQELPAGFLNFYQGVGPVLDRFRRYEL